MMVRRPFRIHADRTAGCDLDHCHVNGAPLSRHPQYPGDRSENEMFE